MMDNERTSLAPTNQTVAYTAPSVETVYPREFFVVETGTVIRWETKEEFDLWVEQYLSDCQRVREAVAGPSPVEAPATYAEVARRPGPAKVLAEEPIPGPLPRIWRPALPDAPPSWVKEPLAPDGWLMQTNKGLYPVCPPEYTEEVFPSIPEPTPWVLVGKKKKRAMVSARKVKVPSRDVDENEEWYSSFETPIGPRFQETRNMKVCGSDVRVRRVEGGWKCTCCGLYASGAPVGALSGHENKLVARERWLSLHPRSTRRWTPAAPMARYDPVGPIVRHCRGYVHYLLTGYGSEKLLKRVTQFSTHPQFSSILEKACRKKGWTTDALVTRFLMTFNKKLHHLKTQGGVASTVARSIPKTHSRRLEVLTKVVKRARVEANLIDDETERAAIQDLLQKIEREIKSLLSTAQMVMTSAESNVAATAETLGEVAMQKIVALENSLLVLKAFPRFEAILLPFEEFRSRETAKAILRIPDVLVDQFRKLCESFLNMLNLNASLPWFDYDLVRTAILMARTDDPVSLSLLTIELVKLLMDGWDRLHCPWGVSELITLFTQDDLEEQGFWDDFSARGVANIFKRIRHSSIVLKLSAMFFGFLTLPVFDQGEDSYYSIFAKFVDRLTESASSNFDLFETFSDGIAYIGERLKAFNQSGNLSDLFEPRETERAHEELTQVLRSLAELNKSTDPRLTISVAQRAVIKYMKIRDSVIQNLVSSVDTRVREALENLSGTRDPPVAMIIRGPPGLGKTSLVHALSAVYKRHLGIGDDIEVTHQHTSTKHQQLGTSVLIYVFNDTFDTVETPNSDTALLNTLQSIVDTTVFRVEAASIDAKAMSSVAPHFALITTNATEYSFGRATGNVDKLDRRWRVANIKLSQKAIDEGFTDQTLCEYFRNNQFKEEYVAYDVGWMQNVSTGNTIRLNIVKKTHENLTFKGMLRLLLELRSTVETRAPVHGCKTCSKLAACVCDLREQGNTMPTFRHDIGGLTEAVDTVRCSVSEAARAVRNMRVEFRVPPRYEVFVVSVGAIVVFLGLVAAFRSWYLSQRKEKEQSRVGAVADGQLTPAESAPSAVPPFKGTHLPWVGERNVVPIPVTGSGKRSVSMHALPLTTNTLLAPYHLIRDSRVLTVRGVTTQNYEISNLVWERVGDFDLVVIQLPQPIGIAATVGDKLYNVLSRPQRIFAKGQWGEFCEFSPLGLHYRIPLSTQDGDCGLPIYDDRGYIVGLHIAILQSTGTSVAAPLSISILKPILDRLKGRGQPVHFQSLEVTPLIDKVSVRPGLHLKSDASFIHNRRPLEENDLIPIGHFPSTSVDKPYIIETCMKPVFESLAGPHGAPFSGHAKLLDGEWVSPITYRCGSYLQEGSVSLPLLGFLTNDWVDTLKHEKLEPLSLLEALTGDDRNDFVRAVDPTKAIGAPLHWAGVTKTNAFTDGPKFLVHPAILEETRRILAHVYSEDPLELCVVKASLKNEVLGMKKVSLHKGRLFYVGCRAFNWAHRKLMLPLMQVVLKDPLGTGFTVALNATSPAWEKLHDKMISRGAHRILAGDEENFDQRHRVLLPYYAVAMERLAEKCGYAPSDSRAVGRICAMAARYVLIMEGNLFLTSSGLTSGRIDTIFVNCFCAYLKFAYSFVVSSNRPPPEALRLMREETVWSFTGDDSLLGVAEGSHFTGAIFQAFSRELGYRTTRSDKNPGPIEFESIYEVEYLKRSFVKRDGIVWGPLAEKSIAKSLCWWAASKKDEQRLDERNVGAVSSAQREYFVHGREKFDWFTHLISTQFPQYAPGLSTWEALQFQWELECFTTWGLPPLDPIGMSGSENIGQPLEGKIICLEGDRQKATILEQGKPSPSTGETSWQEPPRPYLATEQLTNSVNVAATETFSPTGNLAPVLDVATIELDVQKPPRGEFGPRTINSEQDLAQFFARPRKILEYGIAGTGSVEIYPTWAALADVASVLGNYALFRGDPVIRLTITGSAQMMGMSRVWFVPYREVNNYSQTTRLFDYNDRAHFCLTSQLPHIDIDFSQSTDHEIRLPYPLARQFLLTGQFDWVLHYAPLNNPRSITGAALPDITIDVFVSYENVMLDVVIPQGKELPPRPLSTALGYGAKIASVLPFSWAGPVEKGLELGSKVASFLGFSRPSMAIQSVNVMRFFDTPAVVSGEPDMSYTLALDAAVCRDVTTKFPLAEEGDSSIDFFRNKMAMFALDHPSATPIDVDPEFCPPTYPNGALLQMTPLNFLLGNFEFWTGKIKVCFEVRGSPLVRWRIGVVVVPPGHAAPASFPSQGYITHVIEVVGSTCYDFEVPYLYSDPFQRPDAFTAASALHTSHTRLVWFPLTVPSGPTTTGVLPYVNIWIGGGSDFSIGVPNTSRMNDWLLSPQGLGVASVGTFGEEVDDLTLLTRRQSVWLSSQITEGQGFALPVQPMQASETTPLGIQYNSYTTHLTLLENCYLANAGSYIHRLFFHRGQEDNFYVDNALNMAPAPYFEPGVFVNNHRWESSRGSLAYNVVENNMLSVRVPDRNPLAFRPGCSYVYDIGTFERVEAIRFASVIDTGPHPFTSFFVAAGDDYTIGGFLACPLLQLRSS